MRRIFFLCAAVLGVFGVIGPTRVSAIDEPGAAVCRVVTPLVHLTHLREASGMALSRRTPGLLWSHNDSGEPLLYAIDKAGMLKGQVRVSGAEVNDWEDVSVAACPQGSCLYIADIGDNNHVRRRVTVYRTPEPQPGDGLSQPAEAFHATYPDGAHDAEGLFVTPGGQVLIVTKENVTRLYRFSTPLRTDAVVSLQLVATLVSWPTLSHANLTRDFARGT